MSRLMRLCAVAAALPLMGFQPACTPPPAVDPLLTTAQGQEEIAWCWAAAGALAMNYLHQVPKSQQVQQCDEVDKVRPSPSTDPHHCCNNKGSCSTIRGFPDYKDFKGFSATIYPKLDWDGIRALVGCQGKPVPYVRSTGSSRHMLVVIGYYTDDQGVRYLWVNDPMPVGAGQIYQLTYEEYRKHALTRNEDVTYAP